MRNSTNGYAVGNKGKLSRTFDGGQTWTTPITLSQYNLTDIDFFTDSIGYIVGGDAASPFYNSKKGIILKTFDGGSTWAVEDSSYNGWLTSISVVNDSIGYAAGWNGRILKITNGNNNIQEFKALSDNISIFPNPSSGIFTLSFTEKVSSLEIFDILGNTISRVHALTLPSMRIDLSGHSKGIYFVKVIDEKGNFGVKKIIIQ